MTTKLIESLNYEKLDVFRAGKKVFTVPVPEDYIQLLGVSGDLDKPAEEAKGALYVGTGNCCFGYVYQLDLAETPRLSRIMSPDLIVMDMYPVSTSYEKTDFGNEWSLLVAGYGCAGAGVRLLGVYYRKQIDILSTKEYNSLMPGGEHSSPRFRLDPERRTIMLDLCKAGYRLKPGKQRPAGMPSILVSGDTHEFYRSSDCYASIDIGERLEKYGLDREKLFDKVERFTTVRK